MNRNNSPQSEESRVREKLALERFPNASTGTYSNLGYHAFHAGYDCALKHSPTVRALVEILKRSQQNIGGTWRDDRDNALATYDKEISK